MRSLDRKKEELKHCIDLLATDPYELLEALRNGLKRKQAAFTTRCGRTGMPAFLQLHEISYDLERIEESMIYVKGIENTEGDEGELSYDRCEETW